ncbi:HK97 gp10 family phage protein [Siccirubricoccus sp. KC 17139]|uniref:HK97 gp10 family phage protein n=1 Tax=Siccirubricoccus soli TaxID=2899147 RepID=A0ABT1CZH4_9PROT|nr:HK97 gp10 family phage protein [Siccirubricoccus soli]MCO6414812.1 HK97 gp10 family phage protein [Siccirubricoccus soli]MCP2680942.1 HK97 gp10 family phage protein [Siccirubricoccus soli]
MFRLGVKVDPYKLILEKKEIRKALGQSGRAVQRVAKSLVKSRAVSQPGQPPAKQTGTLSKAFKVRVSKSGFSVAIRNTAFYAKFLETGAVGGGGRRGTRNKRNRRGQVLQQSTIRTLAPRPFLSVALHRTENIIRSNLEAAMQNGIKGGKP